MVIRSEAQWLELFGQHEASGLSAAQFCRVEKLCARYFSKRKVQLSWRDKKQAKAIPKKAADDFIKVSVLNSQANFSLELGGLKLSWSEPPPIVWLAELIKALR